MYHPRRDESEHRMGMLTFKGAAVDALLVGRILLVGSHLDAVERAVVLVTAVILAVLDAAMDTMVHLCFVQHHFHLNIICRRSDTIIIGKSRRAIHKSGRFRYDITR